MKTLKIILSCSLCWLLLSSTSCKKDKPLRLPPETTEGRNTFGCKVNGEVFVYSWEFYIGYLPLEANFYSKNQQENSPQFFLHADCENNTKKELSFFIRVENPKELNQSTMFSAGVVRTDIPNYYIDFTEYNIGKIYFTRFDTIERIASGRFNFEIPTDDFYKNLTGDTIIKVTDGRFDVKFRISQ